MRNGQKCWTVRFCHFYCAETKKKRKWKRRPMVIINAHTSLTKFSTCFSVLDSVWVVAAFLFVFLFSHSVHFLVLNKEELSGYWICNANYMRFTCKLFWNNFKQQMRVQTKHWTENEEEKLTEKFVFIASNVNYGRFTSNPHYIYSKFISISRK